MAETTNIQMAKIKPLTLEIEEDIWKEFKAVTTKDQTLNDAVVDLIKEHIKGISEKS